MKSLDCEKGDGMPLPSPARFWKTKGGGGLKHAEPYASYATAYMSISLQQKPIKHLDYFCTYVQYIDKQG